ncbi:hypothetical protein [Hydrogenimonas sp.]
MRHLLERLSQNPWVLWGSFAAGFVVPYAFALFLPLGAVAGWRGFKKEYADVGAYWADKAVDAAQSVGTPRSLAPCRRGTLSFQMV